MRSATTRVVAVVSTSALAIGLSAVAFGGTAQAQTHTGDRGTAPQKVDFALKAAGFGSRVSGGEVPSGSDQTAFMAVGCSTQVGIERENHETEATIPDLGKASNIKTDIWTEKKGDAISTFTRNTVGKIVVAQSGFGSVEIRAISSLAHAWHDATGFHSDASTSVGSIVYTPAVGEPQELDIPSPGQPIVIPGLVTIALGTTKKSANADGAKAQANALVIGKTLSGTRSSVSQAKAQVLSGVKHGIFSGFSAGTQATALDGAVTSGRTPLSLMPCQGTDGAVRSKEASDSDLDGQLLATGLQTEHMAKQLPGKSTGFERGSVAHVNLGGGQLDIDGIIGQANVTRTADGKVTSDIKGSTVGTIVANGQEQEFPDTGILEIPGVAKLERFVTEKTKFGIHVIALRITLLDGTGGVIDLGQAKMAIRPN